MTTVGFIGLGIMGRPMARNLAAAGHELVVHNRSRAPVDALVSEGARAGATPAEVASQVEVLFACLPDSPDVERVVLAEDGVLAGARPGLLLVDCSTISPDVARAIAAHARDLDVGALDAPVSGGERGAIDGTLSIMVGGEADAFAAARPLLEAVGRTIVHVGPAGAGQTVKAANQLLVGGIIGLVSEALLLLEAFGVDPEAAVEVLSGGLAGSRVLEQKAAGMLRRSFEPGFRMELHHKDMGIMLDAARERGVPVPLGALTGQLMAAAMAAGDGRLDHSGLLRTLLRLGGRDPDALPGTPPAPAPDDR